MGAAIEAHVEGAMRHRGANAPLVLTSPKPALEVLHTTEPVV